MENTGMPPIENLAEEGSEYKVYIYFPPKISNDENYLVYFTSAAAIEHDLCYDCR